MRDCRRVAGRVVDSGNAVGAAADRTGRTAPHAPRKAVRAAARRLETTAGHRIAPHSRMAVQNAAEPATNGVAGAFW